MKAASAGSPDETLNAMLKAMKSAPAIYAPSVFWDQLLQQHIEELEIDGFENFKRTVNVRYFNWRILGIIRQSLAPMVLQWAKKPSLDPFTAKFGQYTARKGSRAKSFTPATAAIYKIYVAMLADYVESIDKLGLLDSVKEPELGNPFVIDHKGRKVSQDLCNSIHEFYSSTAASDPTRPGFRIAELGAGYGRLGQVYLSALPNATYTVIDIPPALWVSQKYLSEVFAGDKIFKFREFTNFADVKQEWDASRIRFLAAHQIELLPKDQFDLFANVSSLHEMSFEQIENYLKQIDRVTRGYFYSKQWIVSRAKVNGFVLKEHEYPLPKAWTEIYHRQHPIQRMFFEALYRT